MINVNSMLSTGKHDFEIHNNLFPFKLGEEVICTEVPNIYSTFLTVGKSYEIGYDSHYYLGIMDHTSKTLGVNFRNPKYFVRKNKLSNLLWRGLDE